ncbi:MAG: tetratricopeptide repeat protein [Bacteroidales bacterium]|nr:tetratricopeptide repeat protein [Bacteroidales bacterium]
MNKYYQILAFLVMIIFASCGSQGNKVKDENKDARLNPKPLDEINLKIAEDNDNDLLYIQRADYYLSVDKTDSALRDILIALDIDNENTSHYITLSDAYLAMGNPDKCLDALNRALNLDSENKEALIKKAQLYLIMRNYENTYSTISELIAIDNVNPLAYFIRSMALLEQADTATAIKNLQVAIDQNSEYFEAQLQLGIVLAAQKKPIAINYLQNAINILPQTIEPYYQLGLFFQENGKTESAIQTYSSILDINPDFVPALYNLGYINLVFEHDFVKAIDYFSQVIQIAPNYAEALYNRGYSYEQLGQKSLAAKDYQETLKIKNNYPLAIDGLNRLDLN